MRRNLNGVVAAVLVLVVVTGQLLAGCASAQAPAGVDVEAVGRLVQTEDGLKLCPLPGGIDCPGLAIAGQVGGPTEPGPVRIRGRIASNGLVLASGPSVVVAVTPTIPLVATAGRSCRPGTASSTDAATLEALVEATPSYGGRWWDAETNALVVAFAGGSAGHLEELQPAIGGTVCVVDVAFTLTDLREAVAGLEAASPAWVQDGYVLGGVGLDVASNRVILRVGAVDSVLRSQVETRFGAAVELSWFLQLAQGSVAELSTAVVDPVSQAPAAGGLAAAMTYHCRLGSSETVPGPPKPS